MARVCCDQDSLSSHGCRSWASVKTRCRTHAKVIKDDVDDSADEILYYVRERERASELEAERAVGMQRPVLLPSTPRAASLCAERDESMMAYFNIKRRRSRGLRGPGKLSERFN